MVSSRASVSIVITPDEVNKLLIEVKLIDSLTNNHLSFKDRSTHRRCSVRKSVYRNFAKFTGKHLCQSLFFNKIVDVRPAPFLTKRLRHRCFPVNFAKLLRTHFLQSTFGRLFLQKEDASA